MKCLKILDNFISQQYFLLLMMIVLGMFSPRDLNAQSTQSAWSSDVGAALNYNDNQGRTQFHWNKKNDVSAELNASLGYDFLTTLNQVINFRVYVENEQFEQIRQLSHTSVGSELSFKWQPQLGYSQPFYSLSLNYQYQDYLDDDRDNSELMGEFFVSKKISDKSMLTLGLQHQNIFAQTKVFDSVQNRYFLHADYQFSQWIKVYSSISYAKGKVWSSAQKFRCDGTAVENFSQSIQGYDAAQADSSFNDSFCGDWIAYRSNGKTQSLVVGVDLDVSSQQKLDFSLQKVWVKATGSIQYQSTLFTSTWYIFF
ncbi:MAG: hypothetical protein COW84_01280 [Gammaproteobacteria bacterium CG22_combo_CG10-13_8_21_14_all_40_8]|nr:MAG: hypothetical protein COW84_01280 [Gammaproteobacteria bacterium CG22_combo_CG10-13_8_21_14_all_40_8]